MKDIPADARPREKLLQQGAAALSDSELLALVLRTGRQGMGVMQLAGEMLKQHAGLAGLLNASKESLCAVKGLGPAKAAEIMAVMELARRTLRAELHAKVDINNPAALYAWLGMHLAHKPYEVFCVLFLTPHNQLIAMEEMFRGTLTQSSVYPREVLIRSLHHNASRVILAHNHPSGNPTFSSSDHTLTHTLKQALEWVDIKIIDHVLVAGAKCVSMLELGLL